MNRKNKFAEPQKKGGTSSGTAVEKFTTKHRHQPWGRGAVERIISKGGNEARSKTRFMGPEKDRHKL